MILIIDNYDSFVHNIARFVRLCGLETMIFRNDKIDVKQISADQPSHIILSPGPCAPSRAGVTVEVIKNFYKTIPILGICLGHQAIAEAFGGNVVRALKPMHGKSSHITHDEKNIFKNIKNPLEAGRYHSLIVKKNNLPGELSITAESEEGEIMALQHSLYPVFGVQFHPESVLTPEGHKIFENFLIM